MTSARQAGITPMFGDFRTTFNAEEAARAARGGVLRSALRLLANPLGLAGMLGLPEWALADLEEEQ